MKFADFPAWLHALAIVSLVLAALCAAIVAIDVARRPQRMWIMSVVWPVTALFGSVIWLWGYFRWGRLKAKDQDESAAENIPFPVKVAKGTSHCGAGCTLGDIIVEWAAFSAPAIAVFFGWRSLFAEKTFAVWVPDYLVAFLVGVVFQYFTIKPMRDLSIGGGIIQAVKADAASITAWQVGMYGMMAVIQFAWFKTAYGGIAPVNSPEFWFAMQIAMLAGFATAYPVNWLLIRKGVKEAM